MEAVRIFMNFVAAPQELYITARRAEIDGHTESESDEQKEREMERKKERRKWAEGVNELENNATINSFFSRT